MPPPKRSPTTILLDLSRESPPPSPPASPSSSKKSKVEVKVEKDVHLPRMMLASDAEKEATKKKRKQEAADEKDAAKKQKRKEEAAEEENAAKEEKAAKKEKAAKEEKAVDKKEEDVDKEEEDDEEDDEEEEEDDKQDDEKDKDEDEDDDGKIVGCFQVPRTYVEEGNATITVSGFMKDRLGVPVAELLDCKLIVDQDVINECVGPLEFYYTLSKGKSRIGF